MTVKTDPRTVPVVAGEGAPVVGPCSFENLVWIESESLADVDPWVEGAEEVDPKRSLSP